MGQVVGADVETSREVLLGFKHTAGRHCGSTALQDVMNYAGWPLSEAACFGLGAGLAYYFKPPTVAAPLGLFMGRCRHLEDNFFNNCGIHYARRIFPSFKKLENHIQEKISAGLPVLLQGDVAGLPYYKSPLHFPGHKFVVCGYDEGTYVLADTAFADLKVVTTAELETVTGYEDPMWAGAFVAYDFAQTLPALTVQSAVPMVANAIAKQVMELTASQENFFLWGREAHEAWLANTIFAAVSKSEALANGSLFFYQIIEKRGTGGGAFRGIYLDFIHELIKDQLFPFSIHAVLFKSQAKAVKLLQGLQIWLSQSQQSLSEIARIYKLLFLKKINGQDAEKLMREQLKKLWLYETAVAEGLTLLQDQCN